jgi:signal-transduction protein with cAMP-binding, CBS, and nucleotidyltransferase domain
MALLLSAKGNDVTVWRASADFTATFRQALLDRLEYCDSEASELLMTQTAKALEELAAGNDAFCRQTAELISGINSCDDPGQFRAFTNAYYTVLYDHVGSHRSAPAFYQASSAFLKALAGAVLRYVEKSHGLFSRHIPKVGLIALGPAGRQEFSPFCPLQLMLVHGHADHVDAEALSYLGRLVHEGFEASGLSVDGEITPLNQKWRGSLTEWQQRMHRANEQGRPEELIDLFRLVDQTVLVSAGEIDEEFSRSSHLAMQNSRLAVSMYVTRVMGLSHGIGIMGGFRLEKSGPYRGRFAFLENGLLPLSSAVSAFSLLKGLDSMTTPRRIREGLQRRELNVDLSERLLLAWHNLGELRLERERSVHPDWSNKAPLHLELDLLNDVERESLRISLESVAIAQRHVGTIFNGMEG